MARHPLADEFDDGLEHALDELQRRPALETSVEVADVVAEGPDTSITITLDASEEPETYVGTLFQGNREVTETSTDIDDVLAALFDDLQEGTDGD